MLRSDSVVSIHVDMTNANPITTYFASYNQTAETDEITANTLVAIEGPQTLQEIRGTCAALGVSATLRNEQGFTKGYVQTDGSYSLT